MSIKLWHFILVLMLLCGCGQSADSGADKTQTPRSGTASQTDSAGGTTANKNSTGNDSSDDQGAGNTDSSDFGSTDNTDGSNGQDDSDGDGSNSANSDSNGSGGGDDLGLGGGSGNNGNGADATDMDGGNDGVGGLGDPCATDSTDFKVQLGPPTFSFQAWKNGDAIPLALGSEGGSSVRLNVATWALPQVVSSLKATVTVGDTQISNAKATDVEFVCQSDGSRLLVQHSVSLAPDTDVFEIMDQQAEMRVVLEFESSAGPATIEVTHNGALTLEL